jgi:hypothetical protein
MLSRRHLIVIAIVLAVGLVVLILFPAPIKNGEQEPQRTESAPSAPTVESATQAAQPYEAPRVEAQTVRSPDEWRRAFFDSTDYYDFAVDAAAAALRGDGRAAYYMRKAIGRCANVIALHRRKLAEPGFDPKLGYEEILNGLPSMPAIERDERVARFDRCRRLASENAFAKLPLTVEEGTSYAYWDKLAMKLNDSLAGAEKVAIDRLQLSHLPKAEKSEAGERIRVASQAALRSRDPQTLFALGFSSADLFMPVTPQTSHQSKNLGLALAACELGADCVFSHLELQMSARGSKSVDNPNWSFADAMQSALSQDRFADAYRDSLHIKELIARGDFSGLEKFLALAD